MAAKRQDQWSITNQDVRWVLGTVVTLLMAVVVWIALGIIDRMNMIAKDTEGYRAELTTIKTDLVNIRADLMRLDGTLQMQDQRLTRTNDRQTDQADRLTRIETLMGAMK